MKRLLVHTFSLLLILAFLSSMYGCAKTSGARSAGIPVRPDQAPEGGILERNIRQHENLIIVRLDGATEAQIAEVFGKVVNTVQGVTDAKRYASQIVPDDPQACYVTWRLTIEGTDPFRLQANILKMIDDITAAGGTITLKGVPYRYAPHEIALLNGIRPSDATSRELRFVVDRELMRDHEMAGE